jgi:branched-chain amino acid transport system ATP-binding protein
LATVARTGLKSDDSAVAVTELQRTGLASLANRPAAALGLLQRKRLELARALATRPRVLLLDEVAAGLTDLEVLQLKQIVEGARSDGVAIVWIEHVVRALVGTVERLLCLAGGEIIGDGDPLEVLASDRVREVYLGTGASTVGR